MQLSHRFSLAASKATTTATRAALACCRAHPSRTLWTAATCSHPDLATALSRCLPSSSSSAPPKTQSKDSVTIVLASRSYPGSDLLSLPSKIPAAIARSSFILGAVVDRVPTTSGHGVSTLTLTPDTSSSPSSDHRLIACEPFYLSGAESRRKRLKEKSVGKWARSQDIEERSLDTADAWAAFKSISMGRNQVQVPDAARPPSSSTTPSGPSEQDILMVSDLEVHQFLEALDEANPGASKIGLLASSTPFITGRPVTMFYDGEVVQDGVIGVSIVKEVASKKTSVGDSRGRSYVEYPSLAPLGPAMQITRCRGNIILELDESNATRLLLDRLQTTTLTKDKEYFLATGEPTNAKADQAVDVDMTKATVYKITGGDPSKGNMAVDTVHDLNVGQWVQFIHHDSSLEQGHYEPSSNSRSQGILRFTTTDPNNTLEESEGLDDRHRDQGADSVQTVFGGSSENGFVVGQPEGQTWVCTVADSIVKHSL